MGGLTDIQRQELNNSTDPMLQKLSLGDQVFGSLFTVRISVTAAANATAVSVTVPIDCEVIDVIAQARATSGSGTATLRKGTSAITDAIVMAVNTALDRAATIDDAYSSLSAGDTINVITAGAGDRGVVDVICRRT